MNRNFEMKNKGFFESMFSPETDFLKPVYFDIQVLERYFEDAKYLVFYHDYRGSIVIDDDKHRILKKFWFSLQ